VFSFAPHPIYAWLNKVVYINRNCADP